MWLCSYSGHGNGSAYVAEDTLQQVPCRSAAILMGCSSGRLVAHGSLDASGTVLHYLLAGAYVGISFNVLKLDMSLTLLYYIMYVDCRNVALVLVVLVNQVNLRWAQLVMGWVTMSGAGHLSWYVTSYLGHLSLAIPSWVGRVSTHQRMVTPCSWGGKAGVVRV